MLFSQEAFFIDHTSGQRYSCRDHFLSRHRSTSLKLLFLTKGYVSARLTILTVRCRALRSRIRRPFLRFISVDLHRDGQLDSRRSANKLASFDSKFGKCWPNGSKLLIGLALPLPLDFNFQRQRRILTFRAGITTRTSMIRGSRFGSQSSLPQKKDVDSVHQGGTCVYEERLIHRTKGIEA